MPNVQVARMSSGEIDTILENVVLGTEEKEQEGKDLRTWRIKTKETLKGKSDTYISMRRKKKHLGAGCGFFVMNQKKGVHKVIP